MPPRPCLPPTGTTIHATRDETTVTTFCDDAGFPGAAINPGPAALGRVSARCQPCNDGYRAFFHHPLPLGHTSVDR